jgi:hypothetical protein
LSGRRWISRLVFVGIFLPPYLRYMSEGWPVEDLREKQNRSQGHRRTAEGRVSRAPTSVAIPSRIAQAVINQQAGDCQKRQSRRKTTGKEEYGAHLDLSGSRQTLKDKAARNSDSCLQEPHNLPRI